MEIRKIGIACFIGGVLCTLTALLCAAKFWWVGIPAGFIGGYVAYEFRTFLRAIPVAFRRAWKETKKEIFLPLKKEWKKLIVWLRQPHPFYYPAMILQIVPCVWLNVFLHQNTTPASAFAEKIFSFVLGIGIAAVSAFTLTNVVAAVLYFVAFLGSRYVSRRYWWPFLNWQSFMYSFYSEYERERDLQKLGYEKEELTYGSMWRWVGLGLLLIIDVTVTFLFARMWIYFFLTLWIVLKFWANMVCHLVRIIHSEKRLLCAVDGTLGGTASYLALARGATTLKEQLFLVALGGIFGAGLGILNWEVVSKRIFQGHLRKTS